MSETRSVVGLRQIAVLNKLSTQSLELLARTCVWHNLPARVTLITCAEKCSDVYFIVSGCLRIVGYAANGRQINFRDCREGEHFGEMAAIDGMTRSADVVTLKPSLVASLDSVAFCQLIHDEPVVARHVMLGLARSVRDLSARLIDLSSTHVAQRVNLELLRMAENIGVDSDRVSFRLTVTQSEIAAKIGTTREEVTRAFGALRANGLLEYSGRTLTLTDVTALRKQTMES